MVEGRFVKVVPILEALPAAVLERGFSPQDPTAPLFSKTGSPVVVVDGWAYLFEASTEWAEGTDEEELIDMPEGTGLLSVSVDGDALGEDGEAWDSFSRAIIASFDALGGLVALLGTAEDLSEIKDTRVVYKLPSPDLAMFRKDLVTQEEREGLSRLFELGGESEEGFWYRRGPDYEDGLDSTTYPRFRNVLGSIWGRDPHLHGGLEIAIVEEVEGEEQEDEVPLQVLRLFDVDPRTGLNRFAHHGEPPGGAFLWVYYPKDGHTLEACRSFIYHLFLHPRQFDGLEPGLRAVLDKEAGALHSGHLDMYRLTPTGGHNFIRVDNEGTDVPTSLSMVVTSGLPSIAPFSPTLAREGCVGLLVTFHEEHGILDTDEAIMAFFTVLELICQNFGPVFGFGFRGYNTFVDMYEGMEPPEESYWPYTIYDLRAFPQNRQWCNEFVDQNADDWMFWVIDDTHGALLRRDLTTTL